MPNGAKSQESGGAKKRQSLAAKPPGGAAAKADGAQATLAKALMGKPYLAYFALITLANFGCLAAFAAVTPSWRVVLIYLISLASAMAIGFFMYVRESKEREREYQNSRLQQYGQDHVVPESGMNHAPFPWTLLRMPGLIILLSVAGIAIWQVGLEPIVFHGVVVSQIVGVAVALIGTTVALGTYGALVLQQIHQSEH